MGNEPAPEISLDADLLSDLLARVDDLAELKVVFHAVLLASQRESPIVPLDELLSPSVVRSVAGSHSPEPGEERARRSIDRALADGFLLQLTTSGPEGAQTYILPATFAGRSLLERVRAGDSGADDSLSLGPGQVALYRPNIFALYERHIGPLTPLVAEQLRDAERSYPRIWIEQAMREAAENNKQSWRYVQSILNRWEETGAPDATTRR